MSDTKETAADIVTSLADFMRDYEENVRMDEDIPYPIEVASVVPGSKGRNRSLVEVGGWVAIRPVTENPDKRTFLGVYLGDLPMELASTSYHLKKKELRFIVATNPAIFVPDLKKVVRGMESWWGPIRKPEDLKQITDQDIENVWYVKALKDLSREPSGEGT